MGVRFAVRKNTARLRYTTILIGHNVTTLTINFYVLFVSGDD